MSSPHRKLLEDKERLRLTLSVINTSVLKEFKDSIVNKRIAMKSLQTELDKEAPYDGKDVIDSLIVGMYTQEDSEADDELLVILEEALKDRN